MMNEEKFNRITENALIINADMVFDNIGGINGRNFRLTLKLKTIYGEVDSYYNR